MQSAPKPSAILFENLEPRLLLSVNDLGLVDPGDFSPPIGYAPRVPGTRDLIHGGWHGHPKG